MEALPWILEVRGRLGQPPPRPAPAAVAAARRVAVLVPLYVDAGQLWVLLTRRSDDLRQHRSQIAFPGGLRRPDEEAWDAALRETEEEIGLPRRQVLRLGQLDEEISPGGLAVSPCVGAVPFPLEPTLGTDEVAEVFAVPLRAIAQPRLVEVKAVEIEGEVQEITLFHVGRRQVWGVTAAILYRLLHRLGMAPEEHVE